MDSGSPEPDPELSGSWYDSDSPLPSWVTGRLVVLTEVSDGEVPKTWSPSLGRYRGCRCLWCPKV